MSDDRLNELKKTGISPEHAEYLRALEVAALCAVTTGNVIGTVTCTVKALVADGLIERAGDYIAEKISKKTDKKVKENGHSETARQSR